MDLSHSSGLLSGSNAAASPPFTSVAEPHLSSPPPPRPTTTSTTATAPGAQTVAQTHSRGDVRVTSAPPCDDACDKTKSSGKHRRRRRPPQQPLPWWKRMLIDPTYRSAVTQLATVCYRQELYLLEKHPQLLSSDYADLRFSAPSIAAASAAAALTEARRRLRVPESEGLSQRVRVPDPASGVLDLWDTQVNGWAAAWLGTIRDQQRPWMLARPKNAPKGGARFSHLARSTHTSAAPAAEGAAGSARGAAAAAATSAADEAAAAAEDWGFSWFHPKSVRQQSSITSTQRCMSAKQHNEGTGGVPEARITPAAQRDLPPIRVPSRYSDDDDDDDDDILNRNKNGNNGRCYVTYEEDMRNNNRGAALAALRMKKTRMEREEEAIAKQRRLRALVERPAYRVCQGEEYVTQLAEERERQARRRAVRYIRNGKRVSRSRSQGPPASQSARTTPLKEDPPLPPLPPTSYPSGAATARSNTLPHLATPREGSRSRPAAAGAPTAADRRREAAERRAGLEADRMLGLSYFWDGLLPPGGFIRLAPDPRAAMWGRPGATLGTNSGSDYLVNRGGGGGGGGGGGEDAGGWAAGDIAGSDVAAAGRPGRRPPRELLNSPLCVHFYRPRRDPQPPAHRRLERPPPPNPAEEVNDVYLGSYRQSLLLVHVKIYCRALHEEQRVRLVGPTAHLGGGGVRPGARGAAGASDGDYEDGQGQTQRSVTAFKNTTRTRPDVMLDTATTIGRGEAGPSSPHSVRFKPGATSGTVVTILSPRSTTRGRSARTGRSDADESDKDGDGDDLVPCPVLLHGVPEVPFPVLRVATTARQHDPVPATTAGAISKMADFVSRGFGCGEGALQAAAGAAGKPSATLGGRTAASAGTTLLHGTRTREWLAASMTQYPGDEVAEALWMGLVASPTSQPPALVFTAARVWRQLHYHSRAARHVLRDVFLALPLDAEGRLGKSAFVAFVLALLDTFLPTRLEPAVHVDIAEEEWTYRGTSENLSFATFFERFFAFPFIFLRDLANVTEADYVEFWELVKIILFGDTTALVAVLLERGEERRRAAAAAAATASANTTTAEALKQDGVEVPTSVAGDKDKDDDSDDDDDDDDAVHFSSPAEIAEEEELLVQLQRLAGAGTAASTSDAAPALFPRNHSVLYNQRPSMDLSSSHLPFATFTAQQMRALLAFGAGPPVPGGDGAQPNPLQPLASPTTTATSGATAAAGSDTAVGLRSPVHPALRQELGQSPPSSPIVAAMRQQSIKDGEGTFRFSMEYTPHSDMLSLAGLLQESRLYRRRHEKFKTDCLNNIALHKCVSSTWELYKDEVYINSASGAPPFEWRDEDAVGHRPHPPDGTDAGGSPAPARSQAPNRAARLSAHRRAQPPPAEARRLFRSVGDGDESDWEKAEAAERAADAEVDRLIDYVVDIPEEVFTDNFVSVRERFKTYEEFQQARRERQREISQRSTERM